MHFSTVLTLAAPAMALPSAIKSQAADIRPFEAAGATDSRGPCPMLNTLANHGYLSHDGRNITVDDIADAIFAAANWSRNFGLVPAMSAFAALGDVSVIDLEDLINRPLGLERPASLARGDDSNTVLPERVKTVMDDSADPKYITAQSLGHSRARLEASSPLTPAQQSPARGEAAFVLMLMVDGEVPAAADGADYTEMKAFKDRSNVFLAEERLPVELGWKPSQRLVELADISPISAAIAAAQNAAKEAS
ncbi:Chloroperoxidase [Paramyrothecium foliicola]|nr:Chloroperoxidase [Paramyrothecium foliicola]